MSDLAALAEMRAEMPGLSAARAAVSAIFFTNGVLFATWVAHIPSIKTQHEISDAGLGLLLLSIAGGSVVALPMAGWLVARWGA